MKSMILKDFYNIGHQVKYVLFVLIALLPISSPSSYIFCCSFVCGTVVMTTFVFDEQVSWPRYAMIMPLSKKDLVGGKYVVLLSFCLMGSLLGLAVSAVGGMVFQKTTPEPAGIGELLLYALEASAAAMVPGSLSVPLVLRFGAEKGRMLVIAACLFSTAVCLGAGRLLPLSETAAVENLLRCVVYGLPAAAVLWCCLMYRISCRIFESQELS